MVKMYMISKGDYIRDKQYSSHADSLYLTEPSKPRINIHEVPRSIEAQNRSPITLNIGDELTALTETNVTVDCPTSGVPRPTVTWTKDGRILRDDGRYTIQIDGSLVIDEASVEDSARYTCNADSINGQDSASSTVQIVGELHLPKSVKA